MKKMHSELLLLEYQIKLHGMTKRMHELWKKNKSEELYRWIIDLQNIDSTIYHQREEQRFLNHRLTIEKGNVAKLQIELKQKQNELEELQKKIDQWAIDQ